MIQEKPVKVSVLTLVQGMRRVQTLASGHVHVRVSGRAQKWAVRIPPQELPNSDKIINNIETHNLELILDAGLVAILMLSRMRRRQTQLFSG